ncbi:MULTISPECIES: TetR/AcrR family transcriptional regulator [unclassified Paenibacillus]|uniref:TetR/AcrR family transcriptional regulator n=1 Tax=unclassified Paenibacillus TaxID=185978 RepID=UPI00083956D9|nr:MULTISPECIES: TetR/AcrR family transcriptional regulator [unclassified Paenibacillus]NWL86518.1 TetR/AcrR family transcriptional regulator [Paenibacillus sp. 79R4]
MSKVDRRIAKSQKAIKSAVTELMYTKSFDDITIQDIADAADVNRGTIYLHYTDKYDLLDKLIEEHINELHGISETSCKIDSVDGTAGWFAYFEQNYVFFSVMLCSKGAPFFRKRFLAFVIEDIKNRREINTIEGQNKGLNEEAIYNFVGAGYVQLVEWWFNNEMPYPPHIMEKQLDVLIDRNL